MKYQKRSSEEQILMAISAAGALCILPFFIIRMFYQDWPVALLNLATVVITSALFGYIFYTRRTLLARWVLSITCMVIASGTIGLKGPEQTVWVYPAIICLFFILPPKLAGGLSLLTVLFIGYLLAPDISLMDNIRYYLSTLITFVFSYAFADRMLDQQTQLMRLSYQDPLTNAGNRRALEERLIDVVNQQRLGTQPHCACMLFIDIDEFSKINLQYGHDHGDNVLAQTAALMEHILNSEQQLFRFAGEEFIILTSSNMEQAIHLAEHVRQTLTDFIFEDNIRLSVSIGLAEYKHHETSFEWVARADTAMQQAKAAGRDLCCLAAS